MLLKKAPASLLLTGMAFLLLSFVLRFAGRYGSGDLYDFVDGAAFGIGVGLALLSGYLTARNRRAQH